MTCALASAPRTKKTTRKIIFSEDHHPLYELIPTNNEEAHREKLKRLSSDCKSQLKHLLHFYAL